MSVGNDLKDDSFAFVAIFISILFPWCLNKRDVDSCR